MPDDRKRKGSSAEADDAADEEQEDSGARSKAASSESDADKGADERDEDTSDEDASDEDEDDEGEEEEEEKAPPKKPARKAEPAPKAQAAAPKKRRPVPAKPVLPPESEIRAPSRETLVWLGIMAGATLLMWGSARFACNAHPAQTRKPRDVSTAELSRDPKDAALEMQQRWNSYDFKGALELAKGPAIVDEIKKGQADCDKDASACEQKRKALADKALATAALLSRESGVAKVRVVSSGGAGGEQTTVYTLEQEGGSWKVTGKGADVAPSPAPTPAPSAGQ